MLRELVAEIIVRRAGRLARLEHSADAFGEELVVKTREAERRIRAWDPRLTGVEMVVASANNGAVENVTKEIPVLLIAALALHRAFLRCEAPAVQRNLRIAVDLLQGSAPRDVDEHD